MVQSFRILKFQATHSGNSGKLVPEKKNKKSKMTIKQSINTRICIAQNKQSKNVI